ncbi:hypothetical protein ASPTUDRAFT_51872 [Aspergillus tubingensis CBS 134.48]|uniref:Uncharacterized protein n=1 Tax=Aspergillus tubingensis (strain CBS 134.48) TaxID=767770 RepID=A0A1L9NL48_ASPTC|nr:hypothetical protein ASPTUDRAFT_51872 [Aspergillus tubingensis CBS 134.48]
MRSSLVTRLCPRTSVRGILLQASAASPTTVDQNQKILVNISGEDDDWLMGILAAGLTSWSETGRTQPSIFVAEADLFLGTDATVPVHAPGPKVVVRDTQHSPGVVEVTGLRIDTGGAAIDDGHHAGQGIGQQNHPLGGAREGGEPVMHQVAGDVAGSVGKLRSQKGPEGVLLVNGTHQTGRGNHQGAQAEDGRAEVGRTGERGRHFSTL